MALEAQGHDIIHLELGEPDFETPAHIVEAANRALAEGRTRYGWPLGSPALRQAIADYVCKSRGVAVDPARVVVTPGVKGALHFAMHTILSLGDEVLIPDPGYPPYQPLIRIPGGVPVAYRLRAEDGYQIDAAELESRITPRTTAIVLNSPSNPTGTMFSAESLQKIADVALKHDLWIIADEIYYQIHFTEDAPQSLFSRPEMHDRLILCDGFSKPYAMTGWRLGFAVLPPALVQPIRDLIVYNYSSLPPFIYDAGVAALTGSQECVREMVATYRRRRDRTVEILQTIPNIQFTYPDSAFYMMIDVSRVCDDAEELAERLLDAGVAFLPGASFGEMGKGFLRLAFCQSEDRIRQGLDAFRRKVEEKKT